MGIGAARRELLGSHHTVRGLRDADGGSGLRQTRALVRWEREAAFMTRSRRRRMSWMARGLRLDVKMSDAAICSKDEGKSRGN